MRKLTLNMAKYIAGKKMSVLLLLAVSAIGAYATLGDGKAKKELPKKSLFSTKTVTPGSFSLKSGYTYRGNQVINTTTPASTYISLNTTVTVQKGTTTYIVPLKKKVLLPNVKLDLSNRQLKRN